MAYVDVTDATFETEVIEQSKTVARRRRPVGAVVRSVPDARADHREGRRRHRRPGRAGQGQRRREPGDQPGVPGAVDPGRVRAARRPGRRRLRRRLPGARGRSGSSTACCRPRRRTRSPRCSPPATRPACARCSSSSPATRTPSSPSASCSSSAATATRRSRCSSASRSPSARARSPPPPGSATRPPTTTTPRSTGLLDRVKDDDEARQEFVDILELMGPDDPRTADYRRRLTAQLF